MIICRQSYADRFLCWNAKYCLCRHRQELRAGVVVKGHGEWIYPEIIVWRMIDTML